MNHTDSMAARLPLLYREGELVRQVLDLVANQVAVLDEEAIGVRRSHWFEQALDRAAAVGLGALLDLPAEDWQDIDEYRAWVDAVRDSTLLDGTVTVAAARGAVHRYTSAFQAALGLQLIPELANAPGRGPGPEWATEPRQNRLAFSEFPKRRRFGPDGGPRDVAPLEHFAATNRGLDPVPLACLLTGLGAGPEYMPVLVNLTTGAAVVYLGPLPPGQRLWLRAADDGTLTARLEGKDVTARLRGVDGLVPGRPWGDLGTPGGEVTPTLALTLKPGENALWFLNVAHYDEPGLDRVLLALADAVTAQGHYDATGFDQSRFAQEPAVHLTMTWVERQPASFDVHLPGGVMACPPGQTEKGVAQRERLRSSLDSALRRLRGAGVQSTVTLDPFTEVMAHEDRLVDHQPVVVHEVGPTGEDALPDAGGLFGVSRFGDSTFR